MFGASEVVSKKVGLDTTGWFILVVDDRQPGRDLEDTLKRYGAAIDIQELPVGKEYAYRIILEGGGSNQELHDEILLVVGALHGNERSELLDKRAQDIEAAFAELANVRNS